MEGHSLAASRGALHAQSTANLDTVPDSIFASADCHAKICTDSGPNDEHDGQSCIFVDQRLCQGRFRVESILGEGRGRFDQAATIVACKSASASASTDPGLEHVRFSLNVLYDQMPGGPPAYPSWLCVPQYPGVIGAKEVQLDFDRGLLLLLEPEGDAFRDVIGEWVCGAGVGKGKRLERACAVAEQLTRSLAWVHAHGLYHGALGNASGAGLFCARLRRPISGSDSTQESPPKCWAWCQPALSVPVSEHAQGLTCTPMGGILSGADLEAQQRNDLSGLGELILRLILVGVSPAGSGSSSNAPSSGSSQADTTSSTAVEPASSCNCLEQALDAKVNAESLRALVLKQIAESSASSEEQEQDHAIGAGSSGDVGSNAVEHSTASVSEVSSTSKLPWQILAVADTLLSARSQSIDEETAETQSSADASAQWNNALETMGTTTAGVAAALAVRLAGALGIECEPVDDSGPDPEERAASLWRSHALWRGHWELALGQDEAAERIYEDNASGDPRLPLALAVLFEEVRSDSEAAFAKLRTALQMHQSLTEHIGTAASESIGPVPLDAHEHATALCAVADVMDSLHGLRAQAEQMYRRALTLDFGAYPEPVELLRNFGVLLYEEATEGLAGDEPESDGGSENECDDGSERLSASKKAPRELLMEAEQLWRRALKFDPHDTGTLCNLGSLLSMPAGMEETDGGDSSNAQLLRDRRDEARAFFLHALEVSPRDTEALHNYRLLLELCIIDAQALNKTGEAVKMQAEAQEIGRRLEEAEEEEDGGLTVDGWGESSTGTHIGDMM